MKGIFKKITWLVVVVLFHGYTSAQEDSTDLNFYTEPFVPQSLQDTLQYGSSGYSLTNLTFQLDDQEVASIRVEVLIYDFESISSSVYVGSFMLEDLTNLGYLNNEGQVELPLIPVQEEHVCEVYLTLLDEHGHEKRTIAKYLTE